MNSSLYERIDQLLQEKVRVLTATQIAATWFAGENDSMRQAKRLIRRLAATGSAIASTEMLHPPLDVSRPLLEWTPDTLEIPEQGRIAWWANCRFTLSPIKTLVVRSAETRAPRATELQHDVMLSDVFLNHFRSDPRFVASWTPEDKLTPEDRERFGGRLPDAILKVAADELLIDCIGSYDKRRLTDTFKAWRMFSFRWY